MRVKKYVEGPHAGILVYFAVSGSLGVGAGGRCLMQLVSLTKVWVMMSSVPGHTF